MEKIAEGLKRFNYINGELGGLYHMAAVKMGVSDTVMCVLYTICAEGDGCNQSDVYKLSGLSRQTVNSAIRKMEKEEWIYLTSGKGRNTRLFLTEKGRSFAEEKVTPLMKAENAIWDSWTVEEQQMLLHLLRKYMEELSEKISEM